MKPKSNPSPKPKVPKKISSPIKYLDSFALAFEKYARDGLAEAKKAGAKFFRIDWSDMPFFTRVFNLARYWDDEEHPYQDALKLSPYPKAALKVLKKNLGKTAHEFFVNEDGDCHFSSSDGWDAAFDCGPYMEAGEWVRLMIDSIIRRLESEMAAETKKEGIAIEFCGHDGQMAMSLDYYIKSIKEIRKERKYAVPPAVIQSYLEVFTDSIDPKWLAAAEKLTPKTAKNK